MRYLVISDVHANWEALEAVLHDSEGAYDRIVCLGDFVGYGPDPNRVVEWARANVWAAIRGNHDRVCVDLEGLGSFSRLAAESAVWTHGALSSENAEYLKSLPKGPLALDKFSLVHGSPRDEDEYLVNPSEAADAFPYVEGRLTLFGHTHLQGGFEARRGKIRGWRTARSVEFNFDADADYLINPGSVGQPRDLSPEAAYALYTPNGEYIFLRRVAYPIAVTQQKIRDAGLPWPLAARLATGE